MASAAEWSKTDTPSSGAANTEQAARAAATAALVAGARRLGRHEYRVIVGGVVMMVIPGLDQIGEVDTDGLRYALDLLPVSGLQ